MNGFERRVYGLVLRMHPGSFRNEFGREMMLDFEDARQSHGLGALYWDAIVSLARQWGRNGFFGAAEDRAVSSQSLLNGQYVMICQDEMTAMEFMRGLVVSVAFLTLCGFAEAHVPSSGVLLPVSPVSSRATSSYRTDNVSRARGAGTGDAASEGVGARGGRATGDWNQVPPSSGTDSMESGPSGDSSISAASNDGETGGPEVAFGIAPVIPMRKQILHASGPLPSFEVVSIRPWKPAPSPPPPPPSPLGGATVPKRERFAPGRGGGPKTDRVRMILPTKMLIASAYDLPFGFEKHILGGPDWLESDQYEIQAKIEESQFAAMQQMTQTQQREQVALMEQSLLADRFKIKVHFETREMPVYALVVGKGGAKLTPAKEGEPHSLSIIDVEQGLQMKAVGTTLDQWIQSPFLGGRMVVDQTGLKGAYDFTLTWGREQPVSSDGGKRSGADAPLLPAAIQEQLGLKLVPTKGQVEVIVIDHIERPSAN